MNAALELVDARLAGKTDVLGWRRFSSTTDPKRPATLPKWGREIEPPADASVPRVRAELGGALRRNVYELREGMRGAVRERCASCGRKRVQADVVVGRREERGVIAGLLACGSVWECAVCAAKVIAERAEEVTQAVVEHGRALLGEEEKGDAHMVGNSHAMMLTLTIRHGTGDRLRTMLEGISRAWRLVCSGKPWLAFKKRVGFVGSVRRLEITLGPNGFHPHLHVLLLAKRGVDDPIWKAERDWLAERWIAICSRVFGEGNVPDDEHGALLSPARDKYLTKLGLELTSALTKRCHRDGHRNPFDVARDWIAWGRKNDRRIWASYVKDVFRARQLTWSKGLHEKVKREIEPMVVETRIAGALWDRVKSKRVTVETLARVLEQPLPDGDTGALPISLAVLVAVELGGGRAVEAVVAEAARGVKLRPKELPKALGRIYLPALPELEAEPNELSERWETWRQELWDRRCAEEGLLEQARDVMDRIHGRVSR